MWLEYAIITAVVWGVGISFIKRSYKTLTPLFFAVSGAFLSALILLPFAFLNKTSFTLWPLVLAGMVASGGYIFYFYALEKGKLSLTGTVLETYPLFTVILSALFLHEVTSLIAKAGIVAILVGLVFISIEKPHDLKKLKLGSWLVWGLIGAALTGLGDFLAKAMVSGYDPYSYAVAFVIGWFIIASILAATNRRIDFPKKFNFNTVYLLLGEVLLFGGFIFFYLAFQDGPASIVTPISAASSVVFVILALVWLKEKISRYQLLGAVITILGVLVVSIR